MKNFIWNNNKPLIRITKHGITFNEQAVCALGSPGRIAIGIGEKNQFAVRAAKEGDSLTYAFATDDNKKNSPILISGIKLLNMISPSLMRNMARKYSIRLLPR